jgi:DNA-binding XRE family transcriptional regulator
MTFSEKVKHVRKKLYLSQSALAKAVGVSYPTISRWENGHCEPNLIQEAMFNDFCEKNNINFEKK